MASLVDRIKSILRRRHHQKSDASRNGPLNVRVPQSSTRHEHAIPVEEKPLKPDGPHKSQARPQSHVTQPATSTGQLSIALRNETNSSMVYAYITGQAIDNSNALFLLSADGKTPYYPSNPTSTGTKLTESISIPLGTPGNTVQTVIPRLAGARLWFSVGAELVFAVNPGPGLVEPSVFNESDPNINTQFGFAEFTFNDSQVFVNLSYVDFVGIPIDLTLEDTTGNIQHVSGLPASGLDKIANSLKAQTARDGRRWSSLIVNNSQGQPLRILSPNSGVLLNPGWFEDYWDAYVNQVYSKYTSSPLTVDTQASYGNVGGQVVSGALNFGSGGTFLKPSTGDIFSCSSGPFSTGSNAETNTIIPRLAAAFNRSTLLLANNQPDGATYLQYYQAEITNHYARIVHATNLDGHGYAFPYDDVTPDGGVPQEGAVFSYSPALLTVAVGGNNAYVG